jgi:hypothetical protein
VNDVVGDRDQGGSREGAEAVAPAEAKARTPLTTHTVGIVLGSIGVPPEAKVLRAWVANGDTLYVEFEQPVPGALGGRKHATTTSEA